MSDGAGRLRKALLYADVARKLGALNVLTMARLRLSQRLGLRRRRFPAEELRLPSPFDPAFRREPVAYPFDRSALLQRADELLEGEIRFFSCHKFRIGAPPDWLLNPFNGSRFPNPDRHWLDIGHFDARAGDIKIFWEASRFCWTGTLARAYRVAGESKYLDALREWPVDWLHRNPVNVGPHWISGQEAAIRVMNILLAIAILDRGDESQRGDFPWSREWLAAFLRVHLQRIEGNIAYALALENNHATSEAAGLYLGGLFCEKFLGETFDGAVQRWKRRGRDLLERLAQKLVYPDGTFCQYSRIYHRLFLDTISAVRYWNRRAGDAPFSAEFDARISKAIDWLDAFTDISGDGPNTGSNDGAQLFNLTGTEYNDCRPSIDLAQSLGGMGRTRSEGVWREAAFWLADFEAPPVSRSFPKVEVFPEGGYCRLEGENSWGLLRIPTGNRHRPHHADALHFDLWMNGVNILRDGGTYSYNADPPWDRYFKTTEAHNTVTVDGRDQMIEASRFLWLKWTHSRVIEKQEYPDLETIVCGAEHFGYGNGRRGVLHRRSILCRGNVWVIVDDLLSNEIHQYALRWRLAPLDWNRTSDASLACTAAEISLMAIDSGGKPVSCRFDPENSWESRHYLERAQAPGVLAQVKAVTHRWITTVSVPGGAPNLPEDAGIQFSDGITFELKPLNLTDHVVFMRTE